MTPHIAIVGCSGHWGYVLEGLHELPGAQLVAIAPGCSEEDMSGLIEHPGVRAYDPVLYDDYRQMLDAQKPDIVCVNPFFYLHSEVSLECLRRGIHAFSEKPLAIELDALEQLRTARRKSGAGLGMMLNYRYDPRFHTARRLVTEGAIGEPALGYAQKSYRFGTRPRYYADRATFGGLIPWVGIHAVDWFQWVSGVPYTAVSARHANRAHPDYPGLEDSATCLFDLANGGSAVMSFDYLRPSGAPTHGDDRLRLVGTSGVIEIRGEGGLILTDGSSQHEVETLSPERGLFADFVASALTGSECAITPEDALDITRTCLLARQSADTGQRVTL